LFKGDDAGIEAGSWCKGSSNIQYRYTSFDTSFDNDTLFNFYIYPIHPKKSKYKQLIIEGIWDNDYQITRMGTNLMN